MAVVIHQETWRGKHRHSQIRYEFRDSSGRLAQGKGTDESWGLYEKTWKHLSSTTRPIPRRMWRFALLLAN